MTDLGDVFRLDDFEALARAVLDPAAFAYYAGGAGDEVTVRDNVAAFRRRKLRPRVLVDVTDIDTSTSLLGTPVSLPVGWAPNAQHVLAHPDGEVASARVCGDEDVLFCLSTISSRSMEDVAGAADGPRWFQLYANEQRGVTEALIDRAQDAGYSAIVLTVDLPQPGYRESELRHPLQEDLYRLANFVDGAAGGEFLDLMSRMITASLTWDDIGWIRDRCRVPLVIKGILTGDDAALAVQHGADAVWVSNHGGRQLDRSPATVDVLEEVVGAVDARAEVYLDGGVRRGVDVVIALALGADAVFVGRPLLYALAAAGAEGVAHAWALLRAEVENAMALLGARSVADIGRGHVM